MKYFAVFCLVASGLAASNCFAAAPIAVNDKRVIPVNSSVTINALNNDSDPDPGDLLQITGITQPATGVATLREQDSGVTYTPPAGFTGTVTFTYTLEDIPASETPPTATLGTITVEVVALANTGVGANELSVSKAIESACTEFRAIDPNTDSPGQADLRARCEGLLQLRANNPAGLAAAMSQITPEETLALIKAASSASQTQTNALSSHLANVGTGSGGLTLNGRSWQNPTIGGSAGEETSPWGLFASVQLENADKTKTQFENGFTAKTNSILAGVDYALSASWVLGAAAGFSTNDLDFANADGSVKAEIGSIFGYGLFTTGNFTWDTQVGMSSSSYDISRHIHYADPTPQDYNTVGTTSGEQLSVSTQLQYSYNSEALTLAPSLKISYADSTLDGYGENNAGGFEVILGDQATQEVNVTASLAAQYALNLSWGVLVPNANVSLINQVSQSRDTQTGSFAFAPIGTEGFAMNAEENDDSYYQAALGASMVLPKGFSAFLNYQQTLGYENFEAQQVAGGFRLEL